MEKDTLKMEGSERRESEQLMKLMGAKKIGVCTEVFRECARDIQYDD